MLKTRTISIVSLLALILLLTACGGDNNAPNAKDLISKAQTAFQKVTSYHFNLNAEKPGTAGLLAIKIADGDVLVPDKLEADTNALFMNSAVQLKIIAIGDKQYYTDPMTGTWTATTGLLNPRSLADPQTGISAILGHIENPSPPTSDSVDGTDCWSIKGKLDAQYLSGITGGGQPGGTKVDTTVCIGKADNLTYLIRINGQAVKGDTDKTVRTFKLSKFGETLTIEAPI